MSDLREALEALVGEAWDDGNAVGLDGWIGPNRGAGDVDPEAERAREQMVDRGLALLAAYPVEPADCQACAAGDVGVFTQLPHTCPMSAEVDPETGFARPLLDRDAVYRVVALWMPHLVDRSVVTGATDAVMKLGRPMPTRGQIDRAICKARNRDGQLILDVDRIYDGWSGDMADALLLLLNGTES